MTAAPRPPGPSNPKMQKTPKHPRQQKGGFVLGLIVGLLLGLAVALGVALYITKVPIPFINKVPGRTAEQDAQEIEHNRNWDPNAPLAGKAAARSASGVVNTPAAVMLPGAAAPAPTAASSATAKGTAAPAPVAKADAPGVTPNPAPNPTPTTAGTVPTAPTAAEAFVYFVQAGAFTRPEEAEAQKAKLAIQGFTAKVMEREQAGRTVFRVRLGPLDTRDDAEGLQRKIEAVGFEANLVRVQR